MDYKTHPIRWVVKFLAERGNGGMLEQQVNQGSVHMSGPRVQKDVEQYNSKVDGGSSLVMTANILRLSIISF